MSSRYEEQKEQLFVRINNCNLLIENYMPTSEQTEEAIKAFNGVREQLDSKTADSVMNVLERAFLIVEERSLIEDARQELKDIGVNDVDKEILPPLSQASADIIKADLWELMTGNSSVFDVCALNYLSLRGSKQEELKYRAVMSRMIYILWRGIASSYGRYSEELLPSGIIRELTDKFIESPRLKKLAKKLSSVNIDAPENGDEELELTKVVVTIKGEPYSLEEVNTDSEHFYLFGADKYLTLENFADTILN